MSPRSLAARNSETVPAHPVVRTLQFTRNIALTMCAVTGLITLINAAPNHTYTLAILSILRDWSRAAFHI